MSTIKISNLTPLTDLVIGNVIVPMVSNIGGTLTTVKGNIDQLGSYISIPIQADISNIEANVSSLQSNASSQQTLISVLQANAATQSDLIIAINANVTQANLGLKGYVDAQILAVEQGEYSNVNVAVYLPTYNGTIGSLTLANTAMKSYVDGQITAANAGVTTANVGIVGYVNQSNVAMKGYVDAQTYSNVNVTSFLPSYSGSIGANLQVGGNIVSVLSPLSVVLPPAITYANTVLAGTNNVNGYVQLNIQNTNTVGNIVSADFIATAPNGTDSSHYIDLGINGNNYSSGSWTISGPNDGYLYINDGNLTVGTDTADKTVSIHVGGLLAENIVTTFSETEVSITSNLVVGNSYVPSANNSVGATGQISYDNSYVYVCIAPNEWRRANLAIW